MTRRTSIAAGAGGILALGLLAATAAQAQQANATQIFTPVQGDLALVNLRKLLGCVVDGVWTAAACQDDRPLTVALGYFNGACLILATVLACYLLYSMVADTANDGQALGRATDTRYTLLRVLTGAILALPVKSGLSLVQILVVQLAVWGSGFGDTLWTRVAGTQLNGMYGTLAPSTPRDGDFKLRGKLAEILQSRLYGHVCARALMEYAKNVSGNENASSIQSKTETASGLFGLTSGRTLSYFFRDDNNYFRKSGSICGGVSYQYTAVNPQFNDEKDKHTSDTLIAFAEQQSQQRFQAAMAALDPAASSIAAAIVGGSRDDIAIQAQIKNALDAAYNTANQSVTQASNANLQNAVKAYLTNATTNGWLSAALWQRAMSTVQAKLLTTSAGANATIVPVPPDAIRRYIPLFGHSDSAYKALADKAQRDLTYVAGFDGFFTAQGQGVVSPITTDTTDKQYGYLDGVSKALSSVYSSILGILAQDQETGWQDPVLQIQKIGDSIGYWGVWTGASGTAVGALGASIEIDRDSGAIKRGLKDTLDGMSALLFFLTAIMIAAAFLLTGVVPFVILVHFLMGAFNWFLVIAEAMVAVPVWLLTKFMPARTESFVGNSGLGYMFALGILLRPALIVIALLLSLLLMRLGLDIANLFFRGALGMIAPDGTIATAMVAAAGILVYAIVLFIIVTMSAGQISALPETVLGWIGGQVARNAGSGAGNTVAGVVLPSNPSRIGQSGVARGAIGLGDGLRKGMNTTAERLRNDSARRLPKPQPNSNG
ncbi:DotA/TraY family protein [Methylorubrum thiocyanatum]|uniref:DotA/TraY family protein n=1 Tax=Methylorubrum thiocyanatum TaxID=47958 RepID=UPI003F815624